MQSKTSHSDVRYSKPRKYVKKEQKDEETPKETIKLGLKRSDSHGDLHTGFEKVESRNCFTPSCSQRGSRNNSRKQKRRNPNNKNIPPLPIPEKLNQVNKNPILPTATIKKVSAWCTGMPKFGRSETSAELANSIILNTENKASTAEEKESQNAEIVQNTEREQEKVDSKVSSFIQQTMGDSEYEPQTESQHTETEEFKESVIVKPDPSEKPPLPAAKPCGRRKDSKKGLEIKIRSSDQDSLNLAKTQRNPIKIQIEDHKGPTNSEVPIITINPPEEIKPHETSDMHQEPASNQARMTQKKKPKHKKSKKFKKKAAETLEATAEEVLKDDSHSEHLTSSTTPEFDRSKTLSSEEEYRNPAAESEIVQSGKIVYDYQSIMKIMKTFPKISQLPKNIKKFKNRSIKPCSCWKPAATNPSTFIRRSSSSYALPEPEKASSLNFRDNADCCSSWRVINEEFLKKAKETSAKVQAKPDEVEASRRQIKITLNKLTFDNFDRLKSKLFDLSIISDESLIFLVESILNKACTETKFTSLYAKLCSYLLEEYHKFQFLSERTSQSLKNNKFRRALFESCQVLFEYFDGISNASSSDAKYDKTLVKKKILGNVRFIGELFKEGVILNRIVLECVEDLIDPSIKDRRQPVESSKLKLNEEKLEGTCILLLTGGACFDKEGVLKDTDRLFRILEEIRTRSDLTPRIRFLIMNVLEARKVGWAEKEEEVEIKGDDESED